MPKFRLYGELHITVDAGADFGEFRSYCAHWLSNWKVSLFDQDDVDGYVGKWFMSARTENSEEVKPLIRNALGHLRSEGYKVLRWKAEDTLLDSKFGDTL